jgi:hypothetical protein
MDTMVNLAINGTSLRGCLNVVDAHAHMGPGGEGAHLPGNSPDAMIRVMDRVGVSKACVSHCLAVFSDFRLGNRLVFKAMRKYPDRFMGYAVLNPNYPEEVEDELDLCFKGYGMNAIKWHGNAHRYPLDGEYYKSVLGYAESNNLTMLCDGLGKVKTLRELGSEYRNINFLIAHHGSWDMRGLPEALAVASEMPNVYIDSSGSVEWYGGFERVVSKVGAGKVIFGSDFPWGNLAFMIGRILFSTIGEEDKRKILSQNANRLFKIG